jgi:hypothetical protein
MKELTTKSAKNPVVFRVRRIGAQGFLSCPGLSGTPHFFALFAFFAVKIKFFAIFRAAA